MNDEPNQLPRGRGRGTWRPLMVLRNDHYEWKAIIECPERGKYLAAVNHSISSDGQISPSLGHPPEYPACGWHTHPRLLGWQADQWPLPSVPDISVCERCGDTTRWLSGWGTWSGGRGVICGGCIDDRQQTPERPAGTREIQSAIRRQP